MKGRTGEAYRHVLAEAIFNGMRFLVAERFLAAALSGYLGPFLAHESPLYRLGQGIGLAFEGFS